jgi:hypothetical protein
MGTLPVFGPGRPNSLKRLLLVPKNGQKRRAASRPGSRSGNGSGGGSDRDSRAGIPGESWRDFRLDYQGDFGEQLRADPCCGLRAHLQCDFQG